MIIAIGYDDGAIHASFGKCPMFALYYTNDEGNEIEMKKLAVFDPAEGRSPAEFLADIGAAAVVCTDITAEEREELASHGIMGFSGIEGYADIAADVLTGNVPYAPGQELGGGCGSCCGGDGVECGGGCCGGHEDGECGCGGHEDGECGCH